MSFTSRRFLVLAVSLSVAVPLVQAHPGHDGDHGLTWDFSHFAAHPFATIGCLLVLIASGWCAWRLARERFDARMTEVRSKEPSGEA